MLSASATTLVKWPMHTILDEVQISSSVELCFGPINTPLEIVPSKRASKIGGDGEE